MRERPASVSPAAAVICASIAVTLSGDLQAALVERLNGQAYYDNVLDITWTADTNPLVAAYAADRGIVDDIIADIGQVGGHPLTRADFIHPIDARDMPLTWWGAMAWTDYFELGGVDSWRLPDVDKTDAMLRIRCGGPGVSEALCRNNEFSYMYVRNGVTLSDPGPFDDLGIRHYWSATPRDPNYAWHWGFQFTGHYLTESIPADMYLVWPVADGDVFAPVSPTEPERPDTPQAVPLPGSLALSGLAWLAAAAVVRRRRMSPGQVC